MDTFDLLSGLLDDMLTPAERIQAEQLLATDPEAQVMYAQLQAMRAMLRDMPPVPLPRSFTLDPAKHARRAPWWGLLRWGSLATALVLVVAVGLGALLNGGGPTSATNAPLESYGIQGRGLPTGDPAAGMLLDQEMPTTAAAAPQTGATEAAPQTALLPPLLPTTTDSYAPPPVPGTANDTANTAENSARAAKETASAEANAAALQATLTAEVNDMYALTAPEATSEADVLRQTNPMSNNQTLTLEAPALMPDTVTIPVVVPAWQRLLGGGALVVTILALAGLALRLGRRR